eukprot:1194393-Prorocentrum_minimum.AAC.4
MCPREAHRNDKLQLISFWEPEPHTHPKRTSTGLLQPVSLPSVPTTWTPPPRSFLDAAYNFANPRISSRQLRVSGSNPSKRPAPIIPDYPEIISPAVARQMNSAAAAAAPSSSIASRASSERAASVKHIGVELPAVREVESIFISPKYKPMIRASTVGVCASRPWAE